MLHREDLTQVTEGTSRKETSGLTSEWGLRGQTSPVHRVTSKANDLLYLSRDRRADSVSGTQALEKNDQTPWCPLRHNKYTTVTNNRRQGQKCNSLCEHTQTHNQCTDLRTKSLYGYKERFLQQQLTFNTKEQAGWWLFLYFRSQMRLFCCKI